MKLFDVIGGVALITWFCAIGFVAHSSYFKQEAVRTSDNIVVTDGESWMLLRHEDAEIGYVHETRKAVNDGWLMEYSLLMNVKLAGIQRSFSSDIRGRVDHDGYLKEVVADVDGGGKKFRIKADVIGDEIVIESDLGLTKKQRVKVREKPKLSTSVYRRLAAVKELKPGDLIEDEYFDPLTLGTKKMTFEFKENHEVDNNETLVMTRKFVQRLNGQELDVFIDSEGEVQIQEFPFRIVGNRVPSTFGASRAKALRKKRENSTAPEFDLDSARQLVEGGDFFASGEGHTFRVTVPMSLLDQNGQPTFDLLSTRQSFKKEASEGETASFAVDTKSENAIALDDTTTLLEKTIRVDSDHAAFEWVEKTATDATVHDRAMTIGAWVRDHMRVESQVGVDTASGALTSGIGDCTEHTLVAVAALRRAGIPARFVYGIKIDDGNKVPHQWVEFWDGEKLREFDATTADLGLSNAAVRLLVSDKPDDSRFTALVQQVKVAPIAPKTEPEESDFN